MHSEDSKFSDTLVSDACELVVKWPATVITDVKMGEVIDGEISNPHSRKAYEVYEKGKLLGMINTEIFFRPPARIVPT